MQLHAGPEPSISPDIEALIREHQSRIWQYLRMLGCTAADADDLAQETFFVVLRRDIRFDSSASAATFLRRTARYVFCNHVSASARRSRAEVKIWVAAVDRAWDQNEGEFATGSYAVALARCRERLLGRRSDVVRWFYGDGISRREIAERLGMQETGVKTLLQRARADLRACIEREVKDD